MSKQHILYSTPGSCLAQPHLGRARGWPLHHLFVGNFLFLFPAAREEVAGKLAELSFFTPFEMFLVLIMYFTAGELELKQIW